MILAFNATAYDALPSGAKSRTVGLAAALLRAGHAVRLLAPRGLSLRPEVETEFGAPLSGSFEEIPTPLDPSSPLRRALASRRWFERNVPRGTDAFVTDYYPVIGRIPTLLTVHDLRYLAARYPGADAWQIHAAGNRDFTTPEGIRVAPAFELLKTLV